MNPDEEPGPAELLDAIDHFELLGLQCHDFVAAAASDIEPLAVGVEGQAERSAFQLNPPGDSPSCAVGFDDLVDVIKRSPYVCAGLARDGNNLEVRIALPRGREGMAPLAARRERTVGQWQRDPASGGGLRCR